MAEGVTVTAVVAAITPKPTLAFLGDVDITVPARNVSGLTLAVGDPVKVLVQPRGLLPQVTGRLS